MTFTLTVALPSNKTALVEFDFSPFRRPSSTQNHHDDRPSPKPRRPAGAGRSRHRRVRKRRRPKSDLRRRGDRLRRGGGRGRTGDGGPGHEPRRGRLLQAAPRRSRGRGERRATIPSIRPEPRAVKGREGRRCLLQGPARLLVARFVARQDEVLPSEQGGRRHLAVVAAPWLQEKEAHQAQGAVRPPSCGRPGIGPVIACGPQPVGGDSGGTRAGWQ
mmetsp:Transcript_4239/g.9085  ORF Transcript_4239/g.9085 Transcript_4239/m.9085 type:complete len:217 (-) Transcript_4239:601-1251(-)